MKKPIAALALGIAIVTSPSPAFAQAPITETIGLYLIRIGDFDPGTGIFEAEFYLQITCDRACDPKPELVNGHTEFERLYEGATSKYHAWRLRARLQQNVDLRRFPFQEGSVPIAIEDQLDDITKMVYAVDESSGVDRDVRLANFRLEDGWDGRVEKHPYPFFDQTYSRFVFSVDYSAPAASVLLKDILPAALITLYGFMTFLMSPKALSSRLVISTSALIALVFYGTNFVSKIPHTDYMTFADKYIVINIAALLLILGSILLVARETHGAAREERMAALNRRSAIAIVTLWIALLGIVAAQL